MISWNSRRRLES